MAEYDLFKLAALDETVSHFFFPALALHQRRFGSDGSGGDESEYTTDEDLEPIRIPDTILYSYSKPIMWLYFDEASKRILRRPSKLLNTASILEHFTESSKSKIGVRAWFVYPQEPELIQPQTSDFLVDVVSQDAVGRTGVLRFLQSPKGKGILQHYIDNKTESDGSMKNVYIRCDYSSSHFSTDLLVSSKTLNAPSSSSSVAAAHSGGGRSSGVSLALRFSPYAARYDRRPLVSSVMTTRLRNVCQSIVHRLKRLLGYTVASMHVVCRMDAEDHLYVLWCGSLRLHCKRYAHLSFRLCPQGTVHEPYNLTERARSAAEHQQQQQQHLAQSPSGRHRSGSKISTSRADEDERERASQDEDEASMMVMQLLSNLAPTAPAAHHRSKHKTTLDTDKAAPQSNEGHHLSIVAGGAGVHDGGAVDEDGDSATEILPCCICREACQRGALVKVHLQWVLFCLSLMDRSPAAQVAWNGSNDVPPSVALACPNLSRSQFDRLVKMDKQRMWLRTYVGICVLCVTDCNKANDLLCEQRIQAPSWIGVDKNYVPPSVASLQRERRMSQAAHAASHETMSKSLHASVRRKSSAVKLADMLTYFHRTGADEGESDSDNLSRLKALVQTSKQDMDDGFAIRPQQQEEILPQSQSRKSIVANNANMPRRQSSFPIRSAVHQWQSHPAVTFVGSTKDVADAADLFKSERGIWRRCGFGRPVVDSRYLPPVPHIYSVCFLDVERTKKCFQEKVESLSKVTDEDERVEALQARFRAVAAVASASTNCPDVPCHSPV